MNSRKRWHVLKKLIDDNDYRVFIEVGVYAGDTSSYLLRTIKRKNFRVYGVDPYVNYNGYSSKNIEYIKGMAIRGAFSDSRCKHIEKFSIEAAKDFDDNSIDIVFIDANHKFKWIVEDINVWWAKVKDGGILSGHDYWSVKGGRNKDVRRAVGRFVYENDLVLNTEADGVWWIKKQ